MYESHLVDFWSCLNTFQNYNLFRSNGDTILMCSIEVVNFYVWAENKTRNGSLTLPGWREGEGFYCEDSKDHKIKTFKEYYETHGNKSLTTAPDFRGVFSQVCSINAT